MFKAFMIFSTVFLSGMGLYSLLTSIFADLGFAESTAEFISGWISFIYLGGVCYVLDSYISKDRNL